MLRELRAFGLSTALPQHQSEELSCTDSLQAKALTCLGLPHLCSPPERTAPAVAKEHQRDGPRNRRHQQLARHVAHQGVCHACQTPCTRWPAPCSSTCPVGSCQPVASSGQGFATCQHAQGCCASSVWSISSKSGAPALARVSTNKAKHTEHDARTPPREPEESPIP